MPAVFSRRLVSFLKDLDVHNDKTWFNANRDRYDADYLDPALAFIADMSPRLKKVSRHFVADDRKVGGSMMRIFRDVRFSKDKRPFNAHLSMVFHHAVGKKVPAPGYYLRIEPGSVHAGVGIWRPEAPALAAIRQHIVDQPREWKAARDAAAFRKTFGGLHDAESLKRPPRGLTRSTRSSKTSSARTSSVSGRARCPWRPGQTSPTSSRSGSKTATSSCDSSARRWTSRSDHPAQVRQPAWGGSAAEGVACAESGESSAILAIRDVCFSQGVVTRKGLFLMRIFLSVLVLLPGIAVAQPDRKPTLAWKNVKKPAFLHLAKSEAGEPTALRTSVVRFVPFGDSDIEYVDLVGVVHVGEKAYFETIDRQLASDYDVVLFELAHKEDPRDQMGRGRRKNPFQMMMDPGRMLGLESQMSHIKYKRKHFVHADTSLPDAMERRGDDMLSMLAGLFADMRRQSNLEERKAKAEGRPPKRGGEDPFGGLGGMFGFGQQQDKSALKRQMAEQLAREGLNGIAGLTTLNGVLITERNKVAMQKFDEQVKAGKKRIAIFYGAAHMRDFTVRLVVDHGLRPSKIAWLDAWDLTRKPSARRSGRGERDQMHDLVDELFDMFEELMKEERPPRRRRGGK
ncbi:MAG: hypothetical protein CMJ83_00955 [Planctomycetes bacterium]|nr:hypothetical protein [Planctomycetota bacterium]